MTIYRGYGGVNRTAKEQYRCISGINRTIKEQYRGYGGVNRKVFQRGIGGIDASTLLMLHGESIADSSQYARSVTNVNVTVNSSIAKFLSSLAFNTSANLYMTIPTTFFPLTVDLWVYPLSYITTSSTPSTLFYAWAGTDANKVQIYFGTDGYLSAESRVGAISYRAQTPNTTCPLSTWSHIAATFTGTEVKLYVNGVLQATTTYSVTSPTFTEQWIGVKQTNAERFSGYIDEFRLSNIVRWTANFTPPAEPYSN